MTKNIYGFLLIGSVIDCVHICTYYLTLGKLLFSRMIQTVPTMHERLVKTWAFDLCDLTFGFADLFLV